MKISHSGHIFAFLLMLFGASLIAGMLVGCSKENIPPGHVLVRNDILDKEYNSFVVDQVVSTSGLTPFRAVIKPGEKVLIPQQKITSLRFSRAYKDHTKVYEVHCPGSADVGVSLKLIDIHLNRLRGGCYLAKRGRKVSGVIEWEKINDAK